MSSNTTSKKSKNFGRLLGEVWDHFTRGDGKVKSKYRATCNYCSKSWERGEPCNLEIHLANHCNSAPNEVIRVFLSKILCNNDGNRFNNKNNKRKLSISSDPGQKTLLDNFVGRTLEKEKTERINQTWVKL